MGQTMMQLGEAKKKALLNPAVLSSDVETLKTHIIKLQWRRSRVGRAIAFIVVLAPALVLSAAIYYVNRSTYSFDTNKNGCFLTPEDVLAS